MVIKLKVKTEKQLIRFYRLLPFYKSFIFKYIRFQSDSNYNNINLIIDVLNVKKRKKRIQCIYNIACGEVDSKFKNIKNMCGFKNNKCWSQQNNNDNKINGCCRWCRYQSCNGCLTKNLTCKLFFCEEVRKRYEIIKFEDIKVLKCLSIRQRLILKHDYFSSEKEVINDLYYGSLIIWGIRISYRLLLYYFKSN